MWLTKYEQLSRAKDPSKSSKKNKEAKDGTSSPSGTAGSREATQSPSATPSASTTSLTESRNKPLPPSDRDAASGAAGHAISPPLSQAGSMGSLNTAQHGVLGRGNSYESMGATSPGGGNPGTPARHAILPPSVVISPSAPVCISPLLV